jgi:molecular chaperone GrpE
VPAPRRTPNQDARDQLREEEELVAERTGEDADAADRRTPPDQGAQAADPPMRETDGGQEQGSEAPGADPEPSEVVEEPEPPEVEGPEPPEVEGPELPQVEGPELPQVEEPEAPLERAERERGEYLALAQRTQADFENYRKRAARDIAAAGERAKSGLLCELLPAVDNLERALASAGSEEEHLAGGVRLVYSDLLGVLARNGVQQFDPVGERFDPAHHEALSTRPEEGADTGVVLDVVEKGYRLNATTVLRPARVVVSG